MNLPQRTQWLLIGLGALALLALWQNFGGTGASPARRSDDPVLMASEVATSASARRGASSRSRGKAKKPQVMEARELYLAALEPAPRQHSVGRNPWAFYVPPPPPPPVRQQPVYVAPPPPPPDLEGQRPPEPQPPKIPYTYLGSLGSKTRRIAVFSDGQDIVNVLTGDVLEGEFRVAEIGYESVTIEFVNFPEAEPKKLRVGG